MRAVHPLSSARSDSPPSGRQNHKVITNKKHVRRTLGNTHLLARVLIHKSNTTVANVNRQRRTIRVIHLHSAPIQRQHHVRASKLTPRRHIIDQRHRLTGTSATGNENRRTTTVNSSTSRVGTLRGRARHRPGARPVRGHISESRSCSYSSKMPREGRHPE